MSRKMYINGMASIAAQTEEDLFAENLQSFSENIFPATSVNYKEYIKPMMLRRMSKAIKMGLVTAKQALNEAGVDVPDSIIVGTGEGCKQDTEKFLENILDENESFLTPTAFIQSTHNTVGGQIALDLKCTGYNMTYTQNSASFESALIDAKLQFTEEMGTRCVLVGGVDEIARISTPFYNLDGQLKAGEINTAKILQSSSEGTITSEGAAFFLLSEIRTQDSFAEISDCMIYRNISEEKLQEEISWFLKKNDLKIEELDVVILGNNGDTRYDHYYKQLQEDLFKNTLQLGYKNWVGDYNTVTAYACWLGAEILKRKEIPQQLKLNNLSLKQPTSILVYNQYLGKNHSLTLLRSL